MKLRRYTLVGLLAVIPAAALAQLDRSLPPVREINHRIAVSADSFRNGGRQAVVLSTGQLVVDDWAGHRVILVDPTLAESMTLFDNTSPGALRLGRYPGALFVGPGDTTYLTDLESGGVRVIAPTGEVVRRQTVGDREVLTRIPNLYAGTQFAGSTMYFANTLVRRASGEFSAEPHDSLYLERVNFRTSRHDTLGIIHLNRSNTVEPGDSAPGEPRHVRMIMAPFEVGDAMAVSSSGELAVIRAADFHVDWLRPGGAWRHTPPVQWPWRTFSDSVKKAIRDARNQFYESGRVQALQPAGSPAARVRFEAGPVPDSEPAFVPMSAIADHQGLVWVEVGPRSTGSIPLQQTFAAIDSTGQIVDRIRLPGRRELLGFDRLGRIYVLDRQAFAHIELYNPRP